MRAILIALALSFGLAGAALADDLDGYDCPQLPSPTTTTQKPPPEAGA
jgi:hypothetical protein